MYIRAELQDKLDMPTKSFEVALRSFLVNRIITQYPQETILHNELTNRVTQIKASNFILTNKISAELSKMISTKAWSDFWSNLTFINECYTQKQHTISHDVTFLSQTIYLSYAFADLFADMIRTFSSPEEYITKSNQFYEIRNALSHRGSTQISSVDAQNVIRFMEIMGPFIPSDCFWYKSWEAINSETAAVSSSLANLHQNDYGLLHENLEVIPFPEKAIVCRDPEISDLFKFVCGWDGENSLRNCKHLVCVSGYGGVGKTVLVTEFISQLLVNIESGSYRGFRPEFILFYTAKTQSLTYNHFSGQLQIAKMSRQIDSFADLKKQFLFDLGIEDFDDTWNEKGILVIDNLETIEAGERDQIIKYINYEIPSSVHVIITTRIPEDADKDIPLGGFEHESGQNFVNEYVNKNNIQIELNDSQISNLVKYSYGNTLVLVLALQRLNDNKASYSSIIEEMKKLPKNDEDNTISSFMYQFTIDEIIRTHPEWKNAINDILAYLSIYGGELSAETIAIANRALDVDEVKRTLGVLARYLVVERIGDKYRLNEFAQRYILVKNPLPEDIKARKQQEITSAVNQIEQDYSLLTESYKKNPEIKKIIEEWGGATDQENIAIAKAFAIYEEKGRVTSQNVDYMIDQMQLQFAEIEKRNSSHPYIYYQRARILNELRNENLIGDQYNDRIEKYFERCFVLINEPSFQSIKETKTFPSIQWIYAQFLLGIKQFERAAAYAESSITFFEKKRIKTQEYYDVQAVYGISMISLYSGDMMNSEFLLKARRAYKAIHEVKFMPKNLKEHEKNLGELLSKYERIQIGAR